jgi:hypothetical protein
VWEKAVVSAKRIFSETDQAFPRITRMNADKFLPPVDFARDWWDEVD